MASKGLENMDLLLKGKTVLVTGTGQGIGNALCKRLYKCGANIIAVSKSLEKLKDLEKELPGIETIQVDLADWNETRKALKNIGCLDCLVNNAGVAVIKPSEEISEKEYDLMFDVNVKAVFNVTQSLLSKMKDGSSIVNISSLASTRSFEGHSVYAAGKAAIDSLTRSFAMELGSRKIRVNSINPTVILTQMGTANWSDPRKSKPLLDHIPLNRFGEVNDVINSVLYLLGENSSFVNGHHLLLEGGYSVS